MNIRLDSSVRIKTHYAPRYIIYYCCFELAIQAHNYKLLEVTKCLQLVHRMFFYNICSAKVIVFFSVNSNLMYSNLIFSGILGNEEKVGCLKEEKFRFRGMYRYKHAMLRKPTQVNQL